jgi:hypothetical protein
MRYFFHLKHLTELITDDEGVRFNNPEAARREAILSIKESASESLLEDKDFFLQSIRICDADGNLLDEVFAQDVLADVFSPAIAVA